MKIEKIKIKDLIPAPYNPRTISEPALSGLRESIKRFGYIDPVIRNIRTGHIVGGHKRIDAMILEGYKPEDEIEVVLVDIPEIEEKALNIALNNPAIQGEFDYLKLEPLLLEIKEGLGDIVLEELKLDTLLPDLTMPEDEWENMPGFKQDNLDAYQQIVVSFKNENDVILFADLIEQKITSKTKYIWYPPKEKDSVKDLRYKDAE